MLTGTGITVSRPVIATNGNVTLVADDMAINNTVSAAGATAGGVTLRQLTAARPISLGLEVGTALSLTDAELDFVTAGNTATGGLVIGRADGARHRRRGRDQPGG